MIASFCSGICEKMPRCAVANILTAVTLDNIITGKGLKTTPVLVCPANAQDISGVKLVQKDSCLECGLCKLLCTKKYIGLSDTAEKAIFSNLNCMNAFLRTFDNETTSVASEVKVKGNFREKRIDIVVASGEKVYLIKALGNIDKIPFYTRSYKVVSDYYSEAYKLVFEPIMLVPRGKIEAARRQELSAISIDELLEMFGGEI